jgi:phosphoglycerate dehydrogenase-like enzyme
MSSPAAPLRLLVQPDGPLAIRLARAASASGAEIVEDPSRATGVLWCTPRPAGLAELLETAPEVKWVQLPFAGVERFSGLIERHRDQTWTCAKEIYGPAVAEFALGLLLSGFRGIHRYAAATRWEPEEARTLEGAAITIVGAGGIGRSLAALLQPLMADVTVVSRSGRSVPGASSALSEELPNLLGSSDALVLALPLTQESVGLVDATFLGRMKSSSWLVNVARGAIVVTDDLVAALDSGAIAGAALDVTDPEPLPEGHRLWQLPNAIITPHVANTAAMAEGALVRLVEENVRRLAVGGPLLGLIDPHAGY